MIDKTPKIGIVTMNFYPEKAATASLLTELSLGLKERGCDVRVYAGYPMYWFDKFKVTKREVYRSITIERSFNTQFNCQGKLRMICNTGSFFISAFFNLLLHCNDRILIIVTNPPFLPYIGFLMKKLRRINYIVLVHDVFPDSAIKVGYMNDGILARILDKLYTYTYENSINIIVLSEDMAELIKDKIGTRHHHKITIISNWEDETFIKPLNKSENPFVREHNLMDKFVILYSGNMSSSQDFDLILQAACKISDPEIRFIFIGDGIEKIKIKKKVEDMDLQNVDFLPYQPREILPYSMTSGDVLVVTQKKGTKGTLVSCKLYTAMATGRPILAMCEAGTEIAKVVNEFHCGVVVHNEDISELIEKILELKNSKHLRELMGENGRIALEKHFSKNVSINKYYDVLEKIDQ